MRNAQLMGQRAALPSLFFATVDSDRSHNSPRRRPNVPIDRMRRGASRLIGEYAVNVGTLSAHGKQRLYESLDQALREVGTEAFDDADDVGMDIDKVREGHVR
jgi:hypothetical protein